MNDTERLYRESQDEILRLVNPENERTDAPACPGWTVRDIVAHLTGALIDLSNGNMEKGPSPEWTASHVQRFKDTNLDDLATIWREAVDSDQARALFEKWGNVLLLDIGTHEFDIRGALGNTDRRDSELLKAMYPTAAAMVDRNIRENELPSITLGTEVEPVIVGDGMPQASVSTTVFELSRVISGRRSPAQVRALEWSVDPSRWIECMLVIGRRETDLIE